MGEIIVLWIVVSIVASIVARNKGRSGAGWFFVCLVLTPLAILVLLALPTLKPSEPQPVRVIHAPVEASKRCPQCAETVKAAAKICRFCRFEFEHVSAKIGTTFVAGSRVMHKEFGEGKVIDSLGGEVKVRFGDRTSYHRSNDLTPL